VLRIIFLGTPSFAVPALEKTGRVGAQTCWPYIHKPDRPKGRGQQVVFSPVKQAALRLGLTVHQPERIRRPESSSRKLAELAAEADGGCRLWTDYSAIDHRSAADGHSECSWFAAAENTGAPRPFSGRLPMVKRPPALRRCGSMPGLDTGDMLLKSEMQIGADENARGTWRPSSRAWGAKPAGGNASRAGVRKPSCPSRRNNAEATYAPILKKEDGQIDWTRPAQEIYNRMRGFTPWPGAYSTFRGTGDPHLEGKNLLLI